MQKILVFILAFHLCVPVIGQFQKEKVVSVAVFNTNSSLPLTKLTNLVAGPVHPGVEIGAGVNWVGENKHDWLLNIKLAYFFHRFVQHGIPLFVEGGYRYKFNQVVSAEAALGAGYLHSIPASEIFKLNGEGFYEKKVNLGKPQAMANLSVGIGYIVNPGSAKPVKISLSLQQRLQYPYIRNYASIVPYNNLVAGASFPLYH